MSRNEDLLRSAYRRPTDPDQLERMTAFVRQLDAPPVRRTPHRWATPLSVAAAVAVLAAGTVLAVTRDEGDEHRNEHLATTSTAPATRSTTAPTTRSTTAPSPATTATTRPPTVTPSPYAAVVSAVPAFGSQEVSPLGSFRVAVTSGRLLAVAVTDPAGRAVPGTLAADRTSWSTSGRLAYGTSYRVSGSALGSDRRVVPVSGRFSTLTPTTQVAAVVSPARGATVGVGQQVTLTFSAGLDSTQRAAIEQRLTVTTSVPVAGAWGWVHSGDGTWRVDWRPRGFWPANTRVHVQANLFGVRLDSGTFRLNGGAYGKADVSTDFTIGRDQQVQVDAARKLLVVNRAGRPAASYPATIPTDMSSGTAIVLEATEIRMSNAPGSAGRPAAQWVLRISNSGRFIEAAPTGSAPTDSVLLSTANAKTLFEQTLLGDPVTIVNAGPALAPGLDDSDDWAYTWAQWQQLSAR